MRVTNEKPRQPTGAMSNVSLLSRKNIATCGTDETICLEPRESRGRAALAAGVMRVPFKKSPLIRCPGPDRGQASLVLVALIDLCP